MWLQRDVINIEIFTRWVETLQSVEEEIGVAVPQQEQQQPKVPVDDREVQKLVAAKLFGAAPKAKYFEEYLEEARFRERIEATFSVIGMIERMAAVDRIVTTRAQFVNYLQTALDEEVRHKLISILPWSRPTEPSSIHVLGGVASPSAHALRSLNTSWM